jgi:hypothetical protein
MNARSCLAVLLGLIMTPAVQAQAVTATGVGDVAYFLVEAGQSRASLDENLSASLTRASDLDVVAPTAGVGTVGWHDVAGVRLGMIPTGSAGQRPEFDGPKSDENSIAVLDIGLMLLFAFGLLAYPLVRKQRALRHSLVFASPL